MTRRSGLWLLGLVLSTAAPAAEISCHIHPPALATAAAERPTTIGPFKDRQGCERARQLLFGGDGRCHCSFGFAGLPRWGGDGWDSDAADPSLPAGPAALP